MLTQTGTGQSSQSNSKGNKGNKNKALVRTWKLQQHSKSIYEYANKPKPQN